MPPPDGPDIAALIAVGRESASLEYKRSAPWDDLRVNLIRTVIGMANTRSGGRIVIGMAERDDGNFSPDGLDDEHIASFPAEEDLRATVNGFAQPFIEPLRDEREYEGKRFLVITVPEFEQEPVLCMKTEGRRLREGALYVRSTRKPETVEVRNPTDMRALLALATEKALAARLQELARAGVVQLAVADVLSSTGQFTAGQAGQFERERGDL